MYHTVNLGPTKGQLLDLTQGEEVKLGAHHLTGDVTFKLTTAQLNKIRTAAAAGRGCTLKLSKSQIAHHAKVGEGVVGDLAREGFAAIKPALNGVARGALKFGMDKGSNFAKKGVDMASSAIQSRLEKLFGIHQGSGVFHGMHCSPAMLKQFERVETQHGTGFLSGLLGSFGLGIEPGHSLAEQRGSGFLGDLLGSILGGGLPDVPFRAAPVRVLGRGMKGKGFLGDLVKKGAHGLVDVVADKVLGLGIMPNPLANPNEQIAAALFQKKVGRVGRAVGGQGLYLPGGRGLYVN